MLLMRQETIYPSWEAVFPAVSPSSFPEGWVNYNLTVQTATGAVETDNMPLYLDNSHFPYKANWPIETSVNYFGTGGRGVSVSNMGGAVGHRLLVSVGGRMLCMNANGDILWDQFTPFAWTHPVVSDVDNNGTMEIVTVSNHGYLREPMHPIDVSIHLWSADSCLDNTTMDGTPYGPNWPVTYTFTPTDQNGWSHFMADIGSVAVADVTGDANKEIIFYQRPNKYYGIAVADITPGYLHVLDKDGNELWQHQFPPEQGWLPIRTEDIDADGKAEILLEGTGQILKGDNTFMPGWDVDVGYVNLRTLARLSGIQDVIQFRKTYAGIYEITLINPAGGIRPGWPVTYSSSRVPDPVDCSTYPADLHVITGQAVPGGNQEILACDESIKVYGVDGQRVLAVPEINLNGDCDGLKLLDVDGDGSEEIIALVSRLQQSTPSTQRRGTFLEAYRLDGTRLADSDNRWPVVVYSGYSGDVGYCYSSVWDTNITVDDMDGDGIQEVIQQLQMQPYAGESRYSGLGASHKIEVREIK